MSISVPLQHTRIEQFIQSGSNTYDILPSNLYIFHCEFDQLQYQKSLFRTLKIDYPNSLLKAVPKRQAEFLAGRYCAQNVLEKIFPGNVQVPIGETRQPIWPNNIVGSISHNQSNAICIGGLTQDFDYLGVDIEGIVAKEVIRDFVGIVFCEKEKAYLSTLPLPFNVSASLLFSAKESLFKALFHFVGEIFGFEVVKVYQVSLAHQLLTFELACDLCPLLRKGRKFGCRFVLNERNVITFMYGKLHSTLCS